MTEPFLSQVEVFFPEQPFGGVQVILPGGLELITLHEGMQGKQGEPGPIGPIGPAGEGAISVTTELLQGDGAGNAVGSGVIISEIVQKQVAYPTPTTINQVIACLKAAGLCAP